jgi:uridylate kinase
METFVISLGGSVLAPGEIDTAFLKRFRSVIVKFVKQGKRFVLICGGGKTARMYMKAASEVMKLTPDDLDWLGIHATRLNAQLLRNVLRDFAYKRVITNPKEKITTTSKVIIGAGWKPGRSTDYIAVALALNLDAQKIINITNTDYVFDADPSKYTGARPLKDLSWKNFRQMFPSKWSPGLNAPFDPVAARSAEKHKLTVAIMGKSLENLEAFLEGRECRGTLLH